jgi:uncharacterized damage-inducible protein DinB
MSKSDLSEYRYRGARALVLLHEHHQRVFLFVWRRAREAGVRLPVTEDRDYASLHTLLHHILRASRGYMTWICEKLVLPDPGIEAPPAVERIEEEAERFLTHVLEKWRIPLTDLEAKIFEEIYETRWGELMSIEGMLEHAVMHPMRHSFQLEELMGKA